MPKKTKEVHEVGRKVGRKIATVPMTLDVQVSENVMHFRQGIAEGKATMPDGRKVKIDASLNINGDSLLIGLSVEGEEGWRTYVLMTEELIQKSLADFETRFPKVPA